MKAYGGVDINIHIFLTSGLPGGEWSASRPGCFTPGEITQYPLHRKLVDLRAGLEEREE
jgi:hypothetical protein